MAKSQAEKEIELQIKREVYGKTQKLPRARLVRYAEAWLLGPLETHTITDTSEWLAYLKTVYGR